MKDIVSKRKQKDPDLNEKKNIALHQKLTLALKTLTTLLAHKNNLRSLTHDPDRKTSLSVIVKRSVAAVRSKRRNLLKPWVTLIYLCFALLLSQSSHWWCDLVCLRVKGQSVIASTH